MTRRLAPFSVARSALLGLVVTLAVACAGPVPPPPTATPTRVVPTPVPTESPATQMGEDPADVRDALMDEVRDTIDELMFMADGECLPLGRAIKDDPGTVTRLRSYALVLKKLASQDRAFTATQVEDVLRDLDDAIARLDDRLDRCGVAPGQTPGAPPPGPVAVAERPLAA